MKSRNFIFCLIYWIASGTICVGQSTEPKYLGDLSFYTLAGELVPLQPIVARKEHSFIFLLNAGLNNRSRSPRVDSLQKQVERYGFNVQAILIEMLPDRPEERTAILANLKENEKEVSYTTLYDPIESYSRKNSISIRPTRSAELFKRLSNGSTDWIQNAILLVDKTGKIEWRFDMLLPGGQDLAQLCQILAGNPPVAKVQAPLDGKVISFQDNQVAFNDLLAQPKYKIIACNPAKGSTLRSAAGELKNIGGEVLLTTLKLFPLDTFIYNAATQKRVMPSYKQAAQDAQLKDKTSDIPQFVELVYVDTKRLGAIPQGTLVNASSVFSELYQTPGFPKYDWNEELWVLLTPDNQVRAWRQGAYGFWQLAMMYQLEKMHAK